MENPLPERKQGEKPKKTKRQIVTGRLPQPGQELKVEIITGEAPPFTLLEPTPENLEALEFELLQAEQSLAHYRAKVEALKKVISKVPPKVIRR